MKSKIFKVLGIATTVALLSGLLTVVPALALSVPAVTIATGDDVISTADADYTVIFTLGEELLGADGDYITITFPTGTGVAATADITATIAASPGWVGGSWVSPAAFTGAFTSNSTSRYVRYTLASGAIGQGAQVRIEITDGITNPNTAGSYTLSVSTNEETTAVTSNAYDIINPVFYPLPGVITVYNGAGVQVGLAQGAGTVKSTVEAITQEDFVVELGPGLYIESNPIVVSAEGLTIKASGAVADTVVPANWTISAEDVTFEGLTMKAHTAGTPVIAVGAAADGFTVTGCTFEKASETVIENFITYGNTTAEGEGLITDCTFDTTLGAVAVNLTWTDYETSIKVGTGAIGLVISDNTFKLDMETTTGYYASDWAIYTLGDVEVTGNTFTGYVGFGKGVKAGAGASAVVEDNSFSGMISAIEMTDDTADVFFMKNTVADCGYADTTAAFKITKAGTLRVVDNKITGSKYYVATVAATYGDNVTFIFNELTGNTYGISNAGAPDVDATHNWWGDAEGPATDHNTTDVDASYPLGAASSDGAIGVGVASLSAKTTTGVVVNLIKNGIAATVDAVDMIGIATYSGNPAAVDVPSDLTGVKYFDVFVRDEDGDADTARIMFYGAVTSNTRALYYSDFAGKWVECSDQSINTTSGFVVVDVTMVSAPSLLDVVGTPFILVEAPPDAPAGTTLAQTPKLGAVDVPIDTTFTWPAVAGAVSYEFEIAEEAGQADKFYLKDEIGSTTVNAYKLLDTLKYDAQYWWRVRAVNDVGAKGAWTTAFFTTEKAPVVVEETPPVEIIQSPAPEITLEIPPAEKVEPIPAYLLWAVIAVGAVLVIAVIVLIVRTRRIS